MKLASQFEDIHSIAEDFLRTLEAPITKENKEKPRALAEPWQDKGFGPNAILRRSTDPVFFVGFKRDGKDVWAHDEHLAKQIPESLLLPTMYKIGSDEVYPIWVYPAPGVQL